MMPTFNMPGVRIAGVACAVPHNVVPGSEKASRLVGIKERRFVQDDSSLLELATEAARALRYDLKWNEVDALVFVTQTAPRRMPSISCELQRTLRLPSIPCFDLNMACSGYVYGLWVAASLRLPRVLLVVGDTISRFLDPADASTYPIFGDAVSATAVEMTGENVRIEFNGGTDGSGAEALFCEERLYMDGQAVFDFALSTVPSLVERTTMHGHVDFVLMHQANKYLLDAIAKKARIAPEKVPSNIAKYGNTSSASIPLLLCDSEATESVRTRKCRLAMIGFGAGFSFGGILTDVGPIPLSLVEV